MHDGKNVDLFDMFLQVWYIVLGTINLIESFFSHYKPYDSSTFIVIALLIIMTLITWYFVARNRKESKMIKFTTLTSSILWTVTLLVVIFRTFVI